MGMMIRYRKKVQKRKKAEKEDSKQGKKKADKDLSKPPIKDK